MLRYLRGAFLLFVAGLIWLVGVVVLGPMTLFDEFCGWVERRFYDCYGDW